MDDEEVETVAEEQRKSVTQSDLEKALAEGQTNLTEWKQEMRKVLLIARLEKKAAGGKTRAKWLERRTAWLKALIEKAHVWMWRP